MKSEDEVDDYMSMSFVVDNEKDMKRRRQQKPVAGNKQQRKKQRLFSQQEHMSSTLREGLSKPIEAKNKGFQLLEKFGYKKEEGGLGKFGTGIQEPIAVAHPPLGHPTTLGIGKESSLLLVKTRIQEELEKHEKNMASQESHFRHSLKHAQDCKQTHRDVLQAEKVIEQLDQRADIGRHELWPPVEVEKEMEEKLNDKDNNNIDNDTEGDTNILPPSGEADIETEDYPQWLHKLELRLTYLRTTHTYCLYCGCDFSDLEDMETNCQGPLRQDH